MSLDDYHEKREPGQFGDATYLVRLPVNITGTGLRSTS